MEGEETVSDHEGDGRAVEKDTCSRGPRQADEKDKIAIRRDGREAGPDIFTLGPGEVHRSLKKFSLVGSQEGIWAIFEESFEGTTSAPLHLDNSRKIFNFLNSS